MNSKANRLLPFLLLPMISACESYVEGSQTRKTQDLSLTTVITAAENSAHIRSVASCDEPFTGVYHEDYGYAYALEFDYKWSTRLTGGDAITADDGLHSIRLKRFNKHFEYAETLQPLAAREIRVRLHRGDAEMLPDRGFSIMLPRPPLTRAAATLTLDSAIPFDYRLDTPMQTTWVQASISIESCRSVEELYAMRAASQRTITRSAESFTSDGLFMQDFFTHADAVPAQWQCNVQLQANVITVPHQADEDLFCSRARANAPSETVLKEFSHATQ